MDRNEMKLKFQECIEKIPQKSNTFRMSSSKYRNLVDEVKIVKISSRKANRHCWLLKHYDIVTVKNVEKLVAPITNDKVLYYVMVEELFDVLYEVHESIGHGGRDRMKREIQQRYKNITAQEIQIFLNLCELCLKKRKNEKKGLVVKPMIFSHFNSRCQIDLIDFQSQADGEFKFILVYQDHLTKFVILRPLKSKQASEVADQLLNIFLLFGAPSILQSDNGREFVNKIIEDLKKLWPELKIVHGKPRHSQSQGSVERANQDVENILNTWRMQQEQSSHWSKGLDFVQFMKNRALHAGIKRNPYEAMFGEPAKVGLTSSSLPRDVIKEINTEDDLEKLLKTSNTEEQDESQITFHNNVAFPEQSATEILILEDALQEDILLVGEARTTCLDKQGNNCRFEGKKCKECDILLLSQDNSICNVCLRLHEINDNRKEAKENLKIQAIRMKSISDASHPTAEKGMTVRIKVPDVDRGRGGSRSILGCIMEKTDDGYFQIGTRNGILKGLYTRSQFSVCPEKVVNVEGIPPQELPLRTVATEQSLGTGQGFIRCTCKTKCNANRCSCVKKKILCNSKCHQSLPRCNK